VVLGAAFLWAIFNRQSDISDLVFTNEELVDETEATTKAADPESTGVTAVLPEDNLCNALSALDVEQSQADYEIQMRAVQQRLLVSDDPEHLLTAALLEGDIRNQVRMTGRLFATSSDDVLIVWHSLQICSDVAPPTPACPTEKLEQHLLSLDADNSEVWAKVAANRHSRGEQDKALKALRKAAGATTSRVHWVDTIELVQRAVAFAGDFSFAASVQYGFGIAGSNLPTYGPIVGMCSTSSSISDEWARACLAYGELLEGQAETAIGVAVGLDIQSLALTALNDAVRLTEIKGRSALALEEKRSNALDPAVIAMGSAGEAMLMLSPTAFASYLADIRQHGEVGAQALSEQQVLGFIKRTGLDECAPWLDPTAVQ
jgi:hypothetical protein